VIIGDGNLRSELEKRMQSLGLADDVVFVGNRRDAENFYPALDVVALTSSNEGTPLTIIEAMANARPIIATAVGGVVDLLGDVVSQEGNGSYLLRERGITVPPQEPEAFAEGLSRLIRDAELRRQLGERGLRFVEQNHSKERLLEDIKGLYSELLEEVESSTFRLSRSEQIS
jgi:glycosyltransferase involved in cell wall biosynthesis